MRKPMLVLAVFILALAAAAVGPSIFSNNDGVTTSINNPPIQKQGQDSLPNQAKEEAPRKEGLIPSLKNDNKEKKDELPMVQPESGEAIVEGTVEEVDVKNRVITFTQELDDNSPKVGPKITVLKDAIVIKPSEGKVSLEAVQKGGYVTMVLDQDGRAKSIEINK